MFCNYNSICSPVRRNGLNRGDKGLVVVLKSIGSTTRDKTEIRPEKVYSAALDKINSQVIPGLL